MVWTAIVVTCHNRNFAAFYEKELKLRQQKGLINKDTLIICIEDPEEQPIGSGGATLNAILHVVEHLINKFKYRASNLEFLKNHHILIMHMGRKYAFDIVGKGFTTVPFQNVYTNSFMSNIDLLYSFMTNNLAMHSDPGIYICSTDMILSFGRKDAISIRNKQICVLACSVEKQNTYKHGVFDYDENDVVKNIYFQANDETLSNIRSTEGLYALVNGIIYINHQIADILYKVSLFPPVNACNYLGIDNEAPPIILSMFFDMLLACCTSVEKETYLSGAFSTNHKAPQNQLELINKSRIVFWNHLNQFKLHLIRLNKDCEYIYLDDKTVDHRQNLFFKFASSLTASFEKEFTTKYVMHNNNFDTNQKEDFYLFNSVIRNNSKISIGKNTIILNSQLESNRLHIGENCFLNDVNWSNENFQICDSVYVQKVDMKIDSLNTSIPVLIVFGMHDNLNASFSSPGWTILNKSWNEFTKLTSIEERDLWDSGIDMNKKTLFNAKLYAVINSKLTENEMKLVNQILFMHTQSKQYYKNWKNSIRFSLEDMMMNTNLTKIADERRRVLNTINNSIFVESIIKNKSIQFVPIIKNSISEGFGHTILDELDNASLKYKDDLCVLSRLMAFVSNTLCEMADEHGQILRSGPYLNPQWLGAYRLIEDGYIEEAILELKKLRENWLGRSDLILRAARHYEGAMQAFIRKAVSTASQFITTKRVENKKIFEWVEVNSPARLDLAGAWSDTPPICYECTDSCVTNVAISVNGNIPIGARARIFRESTADYVNHILIKIKDSSANDENDIVLKFHELADIQNYNKPQAAACIMKAIFVFTKLVELNSKKTLAEQLEEKLGGSLELQTWTNLPHGSGLGTSSILIGCVLIAVWKLMKIEASNESMIYSVLIVEQLMTTNGGWQDQVGGLLPGFKFTRCMKGLPLQINYELIDLKPEFEEAINERLILVYSGVTRLAKDLLLNVLRNWYTLSKHIFDNVKELVENGQNCARALREGNLAALGACINCHRKNKLIMAPGSEPENVVKLMEKIEPLVYGMALAGAGGGGFLFVLMKEPSVRSKIEDIIEKNALGMQIYEAKISNSGYQCKFY